jgi:carboxymethylenebutenolidase
VTQTLPAKQAIIEVRATGPKGTPALVCRPEAPGTYPCLMLLHERYGLVLHTEDLARQFAAYGFVVAAPDLFYDHPDQAALHAGTIGVKPKDTEILALMEDTFALYGTTPSADPKRFGLIGVCQTGRYPLVWAAHHPIQAAIAIYGAAQASDWEVNERFPWGMGGLIQKMSDTNVLGIFGEKDHVISFDDVLNFRNALEKRNLPYRITVYPDAPHGWLNDTMPGRYRPETSKQTWAEVLAFLQKTLAPGYKPELIEWKFQAARHADYDFTKNVRLE